LVTFPTKVKLKNYKSLASNSSDRIDFLKETVWVIFLLTDKVFP